ncbi:hypothetical protein [Sphingobacterium deserti]|uniref:Uncharacterized protein n=1 Tax=Sphingobacterium deserti TaxID=1229276 RepID=A0A0B8T166_9SPHI|nr:hypothetical protein [Sphingobacterium deserti]KGE14577.1 hypothetical protein DI53_1606 [Sphingobacterium deserti]
MENPEKNLEKLIILVTQIGDAISQEIDRDNPDELLGKLQELAALQSTASYALALAEQLYNAKIASLLVSGLYIKYSATDRKQIFAELAKEELFYYNLIERFTKNISYSIESFRTMISYMKMEFEKSKYQTT